MIANNVSAKKQIDAEYAEAEVKRLKYEAKQAKEGYYNAILTLTAIVLFVIGYIAWDALTANIPEETVAKLESSGPFIVGYLLFHIARLKIDAIVRYRSGL